MQRVTHPGRSIAGVTAGGAAYVILGVSSLFWKLLATVPPSVLLGYRILVSLVTLVFVIAALGRIRSLFVLAADFTVLSIHGGAAVLVAVNWLTFIWGSINGRVLETGIGYLLAPAITIALGAALGREHLDMTKTVALVMCVCGVALLVTTSEELEIWIYLTIGLTWGVYGFLKKITRAGPADGLTIETGVLAALVVLVTLFSPYSLDMSGSAGWPEYVLIALCGIVSVTPLYLIAYSSQNVTLSTAGFLQYVLPTTQLVVAVVFYQQYPSISTLVAFAVIWSALVLVVGRSILPRSRGWSPSAT